MAQTLDIKSFIVISTGHVSEATARLLNDKLARSWPCMGGPYAEYGWFVYAHDDNSGEDDQHIPDDLFAVMEWARGQNIHFILLDCEADRIGALPFFDW